MDDFLLRNENCMGTAKPLVTVSKLVVRMRLFAAGLWRF
jgi:hypothetical protein